MRYFTARIELTGFKTKVLGNGDKDESQKLCVMYPYMYSDTNVSGKITFFGSVRMKRRTWTTLMIPACCSACPLVPQSDTDPSTGARSSQPSRYALLKAHGSNFSDLDL